MLDPLGAASQASQWPRERGCERRGRRRREYRGQQCRGQMLVVDAVLKLAIGLDVRHGVDRADDHGADRLAAPLHRRSRHETRWERDRPRAHRDLQAVDGCQMRQFAAGRRAEHCRT